MTHPLVDVATAISDFNVTLSEGDVTSVDIDAVADHYWADRTADREEHIAIATQWVVLAFLHYEHAFCGQARTIEIRTSPQIQCLRSALISSAEAMRKDRRCKISMKPPCWRDVQEHHHDMARNDIHRIAEAVHIELLREVIARMTAAGTLYYEHEFWRIKSSVADWYIRRLKHKKMQWQFSELNSVA